jgi:VWFA-related protein
MNTRRALCLVAAFLAGGPNAPLQAQAPRAQQAPVFGADVSVVAVPVFVTDKAGRAKGGLSVADFELEEQGKKVPIVGFLAVDTGAVAPSGAEAGPLLQASARRQFLFLFDLTFSTPTGIMRARDAAIRLVREDLSPSDLAAVATYSPRGVQILVSFTPDRAQAERAITTLGVTETQPPARDTLSIAYDLGVQRWGPGIGPPAGDDMSQHLIEMSRLMARGDQAYYRQRVDGFLDGLDQLVRMLDAVQGRKQVVLLSAGFDSTVIAGARGQESNDASEAVVSGRLWEVQSDRYFGDSQARDALEKVFKSVAATDTVLHTVDVGGMSAGGGVAEALPQPIARGRDTLAQLAANTGGRFVADANDLEAGLQSLLEATSRYYVLAFEPTDPKTKPERLRRLKVRVRGEGLQVSHRRGYVIEDKERAARPATGTMQAAEAIAKGLSGGTIGLRAVAVPYRNARGERSLSVILEVDGRSLLAGVSGKQLGLELFGYAFDADGRVLDAFSLAPAMELQAVRASLEAKGLQLVSSLAAPEGDDVDLRFVVREQASRRLGSLRVKLAIPDFEAGGVVLSQPLAMDDPRGRLVLTAASRARPALEIPFRVGERAFTVDTRPTLRNGARREVCVLAWSGEEAVADAALEVAARLVTDSGEEIELELAEPPRAVRDADRAVRYVVTLAPSGLPPGRYVLRLGFLDPGSNAEAQAEVAVRVE